MNHVILKDGATAVITRIKERISYEANDPNRTDLDAFGVLDKYGNYIVDADECPVTLSSFAPYRIGDKVAVKEAYLIEDVGLGEVVVYKSDVPDTYPTGSDKWLSPVTMPIRYARKWAIVESVECKRIQDLTNSDCFAIGTVQLEYLDGNKDSWRESYKITNSKAWEQNEYIFLTCFKIEQ